MRAPSLALAPAHASPYRWVMLAALWFAYFCFGMVNGSLAPLITRIGEDLSLSRSALGLVMGAWALVYVAAALPSGAATDRFGTRAGIAIGLTLVAISGLARAVAGDFWTLFVSVAVFGLGGPLISIGAPKVIAQWFPERQRGTAMGLYMTGPYLGTALAFATANSVLMPAFDGSWRSTLAAFGALALIAALTWYLTAREPAEAARGREAHAPVGAMRALGELSRVPLVRTVLVITLLAFMFNHGVTAWLPTILGARGLDASHAGLWASIPTLIGVASNLVIPRFATDARRVTILSTLYACLVIATLLLAFMQGPGMLLGLVLLGIARIIPTIMLLILMHAPRVSAANMGAATGLFFTVGEIGGVIGPTLLGAVADVAGSYIASVLALSVLAVVLSCLMVPLERARVRSRTLAAERPVRSHDAPEVASRGASV